MSEDWVGKFKKGDIRALGRLISLAENRDPSVIEFLASCYPGSSPSHTVGITGAPGSGKSTLINGLVKALREKNKKVAVLAVDPVSPFSGGALLGDRIRLSSHFNDSQVYIRSLSTRGKLGGLSAAPQEVLQLIDVFGFDYVLVETVGVGQSEVDIRKLADMSVVVLVPEWGDSIQALKSGVLEIGDLFVVNKADREGADRVATELRNMLEIAHKPDTDVLLTREADPQATVLLLSHVEKFFARAKGLIDKRREERAQSTAVELLKSQLLSEVAAWISKQEGSKKNPYRFILDFLKNHPQGILSK